MRSIRRLARSLVAGVVALPVMLALLPGVARAQESDPTLGYLLAADEGSWGLGGDLGAIRPLHLRFQSDGMHQVRGGMCLSGIYSDYYRTGGFEAPGASFRRVFDGSAFVGGSDPVMWDLSARVRNRRWRVSLVEQQYDQLLSVSSDNWVSSLEGRAATEPVTLFAGLRTGPQRSLEPAFAAGVDLKRYGAVGAVWTRRYLRPEVGLYWRDEVACFELVGLREKLAGWLASPRIGPFHAELLLQRDNWVRSSRRVAEATLEPWGDDVAYHGFLALDVGRWVGLAGVRGRELDLTAYGMKGSYPYAKITACSFEADALFASVEVHPGRVGSRALVEMERMDWKGYGRGHTEFWPFTRGLVDLLGLRRYFVATTSGHVWRLHLGGTSALTKRWWGTAGVNLLDVRPSLEVRHWRPAFLVFGKEDEQVHSLDIHELLVGVLSMSLTYRLEHWEMEYSVLQAVPVRVRRLQPADSEVLTDDPFVAGGESSVSGGGFHRLSFRWYF